MKLDKTAALLIGVIGASLAVVYPLGDLSKRVKDDISTNSRGHIVYCVDVPDNQAIGRVRDGDGWALIYFREDIGQYICNGITGDIITGKWYRGEENYLEEYIK